MNGVPVGIPWETSCWNLLTVTPQDPEDHPGSPDMMLFLLKSLLFLPTHLSMAGNHFHRYNIYLIFYFHNLVAMVTVCTDFGQSLMTCGIRDQRSSQRMSGERTEVGLNPSLREVKQTKQNCFFRTFFRPGLCSVLWGPGSNFGAACWSDTKPTQESIFLPVSHSHQGGEARWGEQQ